MWRLGGTKRILTAEVAMSNFGELRMLRLMIEDANEELSTETMEDRRSELEKEIASLMDEIRDLISSKE